MPALPHPGAGCGHWVRTPAGNPGLKSLMRIWSEDEGEEARLSALWEAKAGTVVSTAPSSPPTSGSSSPLRLGPDPDFSSSIAREPWRDFCLPKKVVSVGRWPDPPPSGTPEPLLPPDPPVVTVMAPSSGTWAGPTQASTTPLRLPPPLSTRAPVRRFCRRRHSRRRATRTTTTSSATSTATSSMPLESSSGCRKDPVLALGVVGVIIVDSFTLETWGSLAPLEGSREPAAVVTGGRVVPVEASREPAAMVTGGGVVPAEVSRELAAVVTRDPEVSLELSRDPVSLVTRDPVAPLEISREPVVMVRGGPLVPLAVSGKFVVTVSSITNLWAHHQHPEEEEEKKRGHIQANRHEQELDLWVGSWRSRRHGSCRRTSPDLPSAHVPSNGQAQPAV
ncbi:hypothetical protein AAY473_013930 [Plecturocebus cupreus]